jgi:Flp pilus assembly protein TadG
METDRNSPSVCQPAGALPARRFRQWKCLAPLLAGAARLFRRRDAIVALEFAAVGSAFFGLMLFIIFVCFRVYVQVALNYATNEAARMLSVDTTQSLSQSPSQFQAVTFCPLLAPFLACSNLAISLQPVTDYLNDSTVTPPVVGGTANPFSPGQDSSLMLLQISYTMPMFGWILPGVGGQSSQSINGGVVTVGYPYENEY